MPKIVKSYQTLEDHMFKILIIMCLSVNLSYASGAAKMIDFMVSNAGIVEILGKYGIKGNDAKQVESYMSSAIGALMSKSSGISKKDLTDVLSKLPVTGQDANLRKELQVLLDKSESEIKKEDVVKVVNHMIYLANRHGKSVIITCADCVNESLAKNGFKFTVENIKNSSTLQILNEVIPKDANELHTFISGRMRRMGLGDYSKATPEQVSPSEERSLALFLGLAENGSADQKSLVISIKKLSTKAGNTNVLNTKLWKIVSDDMSPEIMSDWSKTLDAVAIRAEKDKLSTEEAFYRTLKEKAQGDDGLMKKFEKLKAKRCFFK
jgi:predicted Zn-ribbon and HTH transcriptional regulator